MPVTWGSVVFDRSDTAMPYPCISILPSLRRWDIIPEHNRAYLAFARPRPAADDVECQDPKIPTAKKLRIGGLTNLLHRSVARSPQRIVGPGIKPVPDG